MPFSRRRLAPFALIAFAATSCALAQGPSAPPGASEPLLFAVEIKAGPNWNQSKAPQEQAFFREHSANLRRMREAGILVMGARYSDKGLVVVSAADAAEVTAQMAQDPSMAAGTFVYEVHPFNVFYPGEIKPRPRR
jgi:uncharacterized protein YciI